MKDDSWKPWLFVGDMVLGVAALTAFGAWGGFWLDDKLQTTPWFAITLSLLGMILGLVRMVLQAIKSDRDT